MGWAGCRMGWGGDFNGMGGNSSMNMNNPYATQFASNMMQNIMGLMSGGVTNPSHPPNNNNTHFHNLHSNFAARETAYSPAISSPTQERLSIEAEDSSVDDN